jgi:hypothetical protein
METHLNFVAQTHKTFRNGRKHQRLCIYVHISNSLKQPEPKSTLHGMQFSVKKEYVLDLTNKETEKHANNTIHDMHISR